MAADTAEFRGTDVAGENGTVRVEGPVDAETAPRLQHELLLHSRRSTC